VAGFEAIKQLGENGGGFFGANSAHPFENPNPITNLLAMGASLGLLGEARVNVLELNLDLDRLSR
jgi:K+-transporting ATPase A subunit